MSDNEQCLDLMINGNCTKGEDCPVCVKKESLPVITFNVNAKNYVPRSKRTENNSLSNNTNTQTNIQSGTSQVNIVNTVNSDKLSSDFDNKLRFNLNATEYVPKFAPKLPENEVDDYDAEEFDMIMKDIIDNEVMEEIEDEEESDDEKWFPKYHDCECCKGFVYKCKGVACSNMGVCYCKMREECDEEDS